MFIKQLMIFDDHQSTTMCARRSRKRLILWCVNCLIIKRHSLTAYCVPLMVSWWRSECDLMCIFSMYRHISRDSEAFSLIIFCVFYSSQLLLLLLLIFSILQQLMTEREKKNKNGMKWNNWNLLSSNSIKLCKEVKMWILYFKTKTS